MIPYIINVGLILAGCLLFYKIFLQRETFYRINRYVLVVCLVAAFAVPLLPVPQQWSFRKADTPSSTIQPINSEQLPSATVTESERTITSQPEIQKESTPISTTSFFDRAMQWAVYLYWFGVLAFGLNFLVQVILLLYRSRKNPVIIDGQFRIVEVSGNKAPCSFGNSIFINPEKYEWETYNQIIQHEKIHIRQNHTLDILLAELVLVFQWFNPFAWIYRKELENNLEFLTDDQLVHKEDVEKQSYQLSLLKVSTPHFPLSLTTNYNQSLLKKRIAMMNSKRSNVHTAWKYFFLLPLLVLFACLFNKPTALSQSNRDAQTGAKKEKDHKSHQIPTEGSWFATIKGEKVNMQFKSDDESEHFNSSTFQLSDFTTIPRNTSGTFSVKRDAGTMELTGKFEGDQGMGRYKFVADKSYTAQMKADIGDELSEKDQFVFFFVNVKRDYPAMLKKEGFTGFDKDDLIPLAALNVSQEYIREMKQNGYKDVSLEDLIPLKSLGIDGSYVREMKSLYPNIDADELISFKAQGIDKAYVEKVRSGNVQGMSKNADAHDMISFKAMGIDDKFIASMKDAGFKDVTNEDLISLKALGVTPEYVKGFRAIGYKELKPEDIIPMKAQNITPEYIQSFQGLGYKNIDVESYVGLRAQNVTPDYIKSIQALGFEDVDLEEFVGLKAMGITADYIKEMRAKGFNYTRLEKYITLKSLMDDRDGDENKEKDKDKSKDKKKTSD